MNGLQVPILCVDDDPGIIAAMKRILRDNFVVFTALNGEEGAQILKVNPDIALVMSDYRMPGINGFDFLSWCSKQYPHIKRVALTGYPDSELMKEALRTGLVVQVLAKPWNNDHIVSNLLSAAGFQGSAP